MTGEPTAKLKLSVWRDFVPSRTMTLRRPGEAEHQILQDGADLQQEVVAWPVKEDPFSGISDESIRTRLRQKLVETFEPSLPPAKRRLDALRAFLDDASDVISQGQSEWVVSQDAPIDDDDVPYMVNPLLALTLHLNWMYDVFASQPGISISVR